MSNDIFSLFIFFSPSPSLFSRFQLPKDVLFSSLLIVTSPGTRLTFFPGSVFASSSLSKDLLRQRASDPLFIATCLSCSSSNCAKRKPTPRRDLRQDAPNCASRRFPLDRFYPILPPFFSCDCPAELVEPKVRRRGKKSSFSDYRTSISDRGRPPTFPPSLVFYVL